MNDGRLTALSLALFFPPSMCFHLPFLPFMCCYLSSVALGGIKCRWESPNNSCPLLGLWCTLEKTTFMGDILGPFSCLLVVCLSCATIFSYISGKGLKVSCQRHCFQQIIIGLKPIGIVWGKVNLAALAPAPFGGLLQDVVSHNMCLYWEKLGMYSLFSILFACCCLPVSELDKIYIGQDDMSLMAHSYS